MIKDNNKVINCDNRTIVRDAETIIKNVGIMGYDIEVATNDDLIAVIDNALNSIEGLNLILEDKLGGMDYLKRFNFQQTSLMILKCSLVRDIEFERGNLARLLERADAYKELISIKRAVVAEKWRVCRLLDAQAEIHADVQAEEKKEEKGERIMIVDLVEVYTKKFKEIHSEWFTELVGKYELKDTEKLLKDAISNLPVGFLYNSYEDAIKCEADAIKYYVESCLDDKIEKGEKYSNNEKGIKRLLEAEVCENYTEAEAIIGFVGFRNAERYISDEEFRCDIWRDIHEAESPIEDLIC